jgi:SlyX protein
LLLPQLAARPDPVLIGYALADMEERIEDVEVKLAYQERLIGELDALVRTFGAKLDEALRELKALKETLRTGGEPAPGPASEKPPHY